VEEAATTKRRANLRRRVKQSVWMGHAPRRYWGGDELGLVDLIAEAEEALPQMNEVLETMGALIGEVGGLVQESQPLLWARVIGRGRGLLAVYVCSSY